MDTHAHHRPSLGARDLLRYIGPGFLVTVGFIDPGNWAANIAAGSIYGYSLLWIVTLSTLMLLLLQHNAAHLGIVTGLCLAEAASKFLPRAVSGSLLVTALAASIATALAELLGAAIGLQMLFRIPLSFGSVLVALFTGLMLFTNSYRSIERWIIGFVSLIGLAFLFELSVVRTAWDQALTSSIIPGVPPGSLPIIMSVLGAVVMPHNIFLHSEVIQSRQWHLEGEASVKQRLKFEILDTVAAMGAGWAINSAMLLVAAAVFYSNEVPVADLAQAEATLRPLLGNAAAAVFALALLLAGLASSITAAVAGGSIVAGFFQEPYDPADTHSRVGISITLAGALCAIFFIGDAFKGIIWSQVALSVQLPFTIFSLLSLTSSRSVMGRFANSLRDTVLLWCTGLIVAFLNVLLLIQQL